MKKEDFLKLGLTEELAAKAAEASTEELKGFIPKNRFDEVNEAKKQLEKDVAARDEQLETLKKSSGDVEALKKSIEELQGKNAADKSEYEAKVKQVQINAAVEAALLGAGAKNTKAVKALLDLQNAEIEGDGVKGLADQIKKLQTEEGTKFLFGSPNTMKGFKPAEGGEIQNGDKNPWSKDHFNLTEQGRILKENPELAAQMQAAKN